MCQSRLKNITSLQQFSTKMFQLKNIFNELIANGGQGPICTFLYNSTPTVTDLTGVTHSHGPSP